MKRANIWKGKLGWQSEFDHLCACWMNVKDGMERGVVRTDERGEITAIDLEGTLEAAKEGAAQ